MLTAQKVKRLAVPAGVMLASILICIMVGCSSQEMNSSAGLNSTTQPIHASIFEPTTHKSGNQLWVDNCTRCHNVRPPQYYSDGQWDIIVTHMRIRANLTGEEQREITKFLQASN